MAGGKPPPSHKPSSSGAKRSRWESEKNLQEKPKPSNTDAKQSKEEKFPRSPQVTVSTAGPSRHPLPLSPPPFGDPSAFGGPPPPPAPPSYGFHMLDRRSIVLADGSVRSYFALPPDYSDFLPGRPPIDDRLFPYGPPPGGVDSLDRERFPRRFSPDGHRYDREREDFRGMENPMKRKFGEEELGFGDNRFFGSRLRDEEIARQQQRQFLQYAAVNSPGGVERASKGVKREEGVGEGRKEDVHGDVDQNAVKKAFLKFVKILNENPSQKKEFLEDGRAGPLHCIVCGRASKQFSDMHNLTMHAYMTRNADLRIDHLGLHRALCVLMGWNYAKAPENSKSYQSLSRDDAAANRDDLIIWPPVVVVHNASTKKGKDGRVEGLGNKEMDIKLKELGFVGGKSKTMYGKEGYLGTTLVKFAATQAGLHEADRLGQYFEKESHGRKNWEQIQSLHSGDDEKNPDLVKVDMRTGERKRIFYGYVATAWDMEKLDLEHRKKAVVKSRKNFDLSD